jgi:hypothetical protein
MSIVTNKHHDFSGALRDNAKCAICGYWVRPPYLEWIAETTIRICGRCCHSIKGGLVADLVQIAAIVDLQEYYPSFTLTREQECVLEKRIEDERERMEASLLREIDGNDSPEAA